MQTQNDWTLAGRLFQPERFDSPFFVKEMDGGGRFVKFSVETQEPRRDGTPYGVEHAVTLFDEQVGAGLVTQLLNSVAGQPVRVTGSAVYHQGRAQLRAKTLELLDGDGGSSGGGGEEQLDLPL